MPLPRLPRPPGAALLWLCLWGAPAAAAPQVTLLDLAPGDCLGSGLGVVEGPPPGGIFEPPPVDVPLRLRLAAPEGGPLVVALRVDGVEVSRVVFADPPAAPFETEVLQLPAAVADGLDRLLEVEATALGQSALASLRLDLDRAAPAVVFAEAGLEAQGACFEGAPPPLDFAVEDALDLAPEVVVRALEEGCQRLQVVEAVDRCGNGQRVAFVTLAAPAQPPEITLLGVAPGAVVDRARLAWQVEAGAGCVLSEVATLERIGAAPGPLLAGEAIVAPGDYVATVAVTTCGAAAPVVAAVNFTVTGEPAADLGGPYRVSQGAPLVLDGAASSAPPEAGPIVEYAWDLDGDGFFSRAEPRGAQVPFDTDADGVFPVGLRITTAGGFVGFAYGSVIVDDVDPVCAAGGPYRVAQGVALTLDGSGSAAGHPVEPIVLYDWDFGDGRFPQRGLNPRPVHRYQDEGPFTVRLSVADRDSARACEAAVEVLDVQPEIRGLAALDADALQKGSEVRFTAGLTGPGSDAEPIVAFRWDFGDGATAEGPALRAVSHVYDRSGEFDVCLQVDDVDSTVEACITVVVADVDPVARLAGPAFAVEGQPVGFSALGSRAGGIFDPIVRYEWDFGDGSPPRVVADPSETEVVHVFRRDGELTVTLRVHDPDSFSERSLAIFVDDARPTARFAVAGGLRLPEGTPIGLDGSESSPGAPSDPIAVYQWDFGDGATASGGLEAAAVSHAWPDQGVYAVRLVVVDSDGSRAAAQQLIEVFNVPPRNLRIEGPAVVEVGAEVRYTAHWEDAAGDLGRVRWSLGDGTEVDRSVVSHRYQAPGYYTQRLVVDDGDGGVSRLDFGVVVTAAAPRLEGPAEVVGVESEPLSLRIVARPASQGEGPLDGPLAFRVTAAPDGLRWAPAVGPEVDFAQAQPVDFHWTPGPGDAGVHTLRLLARAPSGTERSVEVRLVIAARGDARLLAATADGRLLIHGWARDPLYGRVRFLPLGTLVTGRLRDLALDGGRRLAVAVRPEAGTCLLVDLAVTPPRIARRVPLGGAPVALALGLDHAYVVDPRGVVAAVDLDTHKRAGQLRHEALVGAVALAWLDPARVAGLAAPTLVALTAAGDLVALPAADVLRGQTDPVVASLGTAASRLAVDPATGSLWVARGRPRDVVSVDVAAWLAGAPALGEPLPTPFAARALGRDALGGLWAVTDRGLERLAAEGPQLVFSGRLQALAVLPAGLYGGLPVAVGTSARVEITDARSELLDAAPAGAVIGLAAGVLE